MNLPVLLAHGALGPFDEILFLGIAVIFLAMMGISWVRSRHADPDAVEPEAVELPSLPVEIEAEGPAHFPLE
ncbi:MAG: hypothetical protein DIU68_005295 [Chloroflexota bacterium]|nr:MAG: hypothetical protein DIU68_01120 [Chloroflexota bacterium]